MTVLLQQFIFTNDPETVNQFCEDEERPYFHFDTRNAAKELKQFQRAKNKSRSSFEKLLDCHGLSNLEKSIQQTSCDEKQLTKLRKLYSLMSDLEKIAIGRGKELPNLSVELIIQLSTLKNQK